MSEIVDLLQDFGELAHWTQCPASEVGDLSCPPIITWRYKHPTKEVADFLQRVVDGYRGPISWEFSAVERTWTLMPSRIREYSKTHGNLGGLAVARELMEKEPDFGIGANADLPLLMQHIRCQWEKGQGTFFAKTKTAG
jgi:hypothetical protein